MPYPIHLTRDEHRDYHIAAGDDKLITHLRNQQTLAAKMIDERDAKIAWLEAELDRLRAPNYESYWA